MASQTNEIVSKFRTIVRDPKLFKANVHALTRQNMLKNEIITINQGFKDGNRHMIHEACLGCYEDIIAPIEHPSIETFKTQHQYTCKSKFNTISNLLEVTNAELLEIQEQKKKAKALPSCPKCGHNANGDKYRLKRHIETCQGAKQKVIMRKCPYCDFQNIDTYKINRHMCGCKARIEIEGKGTVPAKEVVLIYEDNTSAPAPAPSAPLPAPAQQAPKNVTFATPVQKASPVAMQSKEHKLAMMDLKDALGIEDDDEDEETISEVEVLEEAVRVIKMTDTKVEKAVQKHEQRYKKLEQEHERLQATMDALKYVISDFLATTNSIEGNQLRYEVSRFFNESMASMLETPAQTPQTLTPPYGPEISTVILPFAPEDTVELPVQKIEDCEEDREAESEDEESMLETMASPQPVEPAQPAQPALQNTANQPEETPAKKPIRKASAIRKTKLASNVITILKDIKNGCDVFEIQSSPEFTSFVPQDQDETFVYVNIMNWFNAVNQSAKTRIENTLMALLEKSEEE